MLALSTFPPIRHIGAVALALLTAFVWAPSANAWWNDAWSFRKQIVLDTSDAGLPVSTALADVPVAVRLHTGNFPYFVDVQEAGEDIRFVASDDATPLAFHIEKFDASAGLAVIWVRVPRLAPDDGEQHVWMYYGNAEAVAASDAAASYDTDQTLVMHFAETQGLPRDTTAFGHGADQSSVTLGAPGIFDLGVELDGSQSLTIGQVPALDLPADRGFTFTAWLYPKSTDTAGSLYRQSAGEQAFEIGVDETGAPYARLTVSEEAVELISTLPLEADRWQHLAVVWSRELIIYVDGVEVARQPQPRVALRGDVVIGATEQAGGFVGLIDELGLARDVRSAELIRVAALGTSPDTKLIAYGEDESEGSDDIDPSNLR